MGKIAKLYMRYSSANQNEQSIEGQRTVCMAFAEREGYTITGEYIDRAISGRTDDRPGFQQMIADSNLKTFQYVIVYKGDRFARDRYASAIYKKKLKDNGVKLISATEQIPDTPEGIILESLMEGLSEYYSAELAQKVKRGMIESAKKGLVTSNMPFGYVVRERKAYADEQRAPYVQKMFELYADGFPAIKIEQYFAEQHVTNADGSAVKAKQIYKLLRNKKYIGKAVYSNTEIPSVCPVLVDEELFNHVQDMLDAHKQERISRDSAYMLSAKCICGECGSLINGECGTSTSGKLYYYYKCSKQKKTKECSLKPVPKKELEQLVFSACTEIIKGGFIEKIIDKAFDIRQQQLEHDTSLKFLEEDLKQKQKKFDNYIEAIGNGIFAGITNEILLKAQADVEAAKIALNEQKAHLSQRATKDEYRAFMDRFINMQIDNPEFYKRITSLLIDKVKVYNDKVEIYFKFDKQKSTKMISHSDAFERSDTFVDLNHWRMNPNIDNSDEIILFFGGFVCIVHRS